MSNQVAHISIPSNVNGELFKRDLISLCSQYMIGIQYSIEYSNEEQRLKAIRAKKSEYFKKRAMWASIRAKQINKKQHG